MFFSHLYNIDPQYQIGITNLLSNITTREGSHKGGWAKLLKCQLHNLGYPNVKILNNKDSLSDFHSIIFDLGAEFSGALNMFGGLDEKVFKRLNEIKSYEGRLYSWRNTPPSVLTLSGRRTNDSSCAAFKQTPETFLQEVQSVLDRTIVFQHVYRTNKVLIGDSHTPSVWTPEYMIERRDGRTLKGMVDNHTVQKILNNHSDVEDVLIHCSSIDIRHHACRDPNPEQYVLDILNKLGNQLSQARKSNQLLNVELVHTVGIEDESRELPKTGYFKGTPFFGDWARRIMVRDYFNEKLKEMCYMNTQPTNLWSVVSFPDYFFDESGKLKFEVMERPQSVHLSPEHYRWDLDKNIKRW